MLPIDPLLPEICATLIREGRAVLQAPPGAGKTTRVPLALAERIDGKILMLEPRRIAARSAADRLAQSRPKGDVGYRMRGQSQSGRRIEVITEGILTRMLNSDPELPGVSAVIFDEFHERSLNTDLGLALALETRDILRPDLKILVMSATLDDAEVARLMDEAPIITSEGRAFPVEIKHLPRPRRGHFESDMADLIIDALAQTKGGALAFLPGEREIRQVASKLTGRIAKNIEIMPLYGSLPFAQQQNAVQPLDSKTGKRKLVLATSIAETSLTIEDIRVVIDGGLARRAAFDPGSGMSRLLTERVTRAEATQRSGRAGRVAEGTCYRLWAKAEEGALSAFAPAEIERADLCGLALDMAQWGSEDLPFLTPPPKGNLEVAKTLLADLGALDDGKITAHGQAMVKLPLHPRLAHMLLTCGAPAAECAALLSDRDFLSRAGTDITKRLKALRQGDGRVPRQTRDRIGKEIKRLSKLVSHVSAPEYSPAVAIAQAYPDRIGLRRKGSDPRWLLSGGRGATMMGDDALAGARLIIAPVLDGAGREAKIRLAIQISEADLRESFADHIRTIDSCTWSNKDRRIIATRSEMLGAISLSAVKWDAPDAALTNARMVGMRQLGLNFSKAAKRLITRVQLGREAGIDLPDMSDTALLESLEDWLAPYLQGARSAADLKAIDLLPALEAMLSWEQKQALDQAAPAGFKTPLGRKIPITYDGETPVIEVRLQEMLGVSTHPTIGNVPVKVILLSPRQKPIQITTDLPRFWSSSYADLRKDMRAQYPKHHWPENPMEAEPTLRAKPRK